MTKGKLLRMDNVGIVVESLDTAISFFTEPGLSVEGRYDIKGEWAGCVTGLGRQQVEVVMMDTRWQEPAGDLTIYQPFSYCRSPKRPGECARLPARDVCG